MGQNKILGIGIIGTGFMGKAHAWAFGNVARFFPVQQKPILKIISNTSTERAKIAALQLGFEQATNDWKSVIHHPEVDIVSITTPNHLHMEMALEAIAAKKIVYCEKPLTTNLNDTITLVNAADKANITTMVGFNYLHNPMMVTAKEIIQSGEIGEITGYRGIHSEEIVSRSTSEKWRLSKSKEGGVLGDLGSHTLATARFLLGEIESVCGKLDYIYTSQFKETEHVEDQVNSLVKFKNYPFTGMITASWLATGWEMHHGFEICGSKGSLVFDQARFNELKIYKGDQKTGRRGFTTITAGTEHKGYAEFCPASGHQIGFNDLKILEVKYLLECIEKDKKTDFSFQDALTIERISQAIALSSKENCWIQVTDIPS